MSSQQPLPSHFGRYQVLEELGQGAMGVVYLCVDARLARPVAVKVLKSLEHRPADERANLLERFKREAEAAGRLNHPDIVQIYDVGPNFLVMEFLEGRSLAQALADGTPFPVRSACSVVLRIADALDYAHRHGIVHRDVKPGNIMLTNDGGVKVLDFGVARLQESNFTVAGTVVGSVRYMAPEQMMGETIDGRADVFSLSAVAYELLTGQPPFPGKTVTDVVSMVVGGHHVPARQVDARMPEPLDAVFDQALSRFPDARPALAMDFARAFYEAAGPILELEVLHEKPIPSPTEADVAEARTRATLARPSTQSHSRADRDGLLLVDSEPRGARVYLDGEPAGVTPLSGVACSFGRHVVRLEADGCEPFSAELELTRRLPLRALTASLAPPRQEGLQPGQLVPFGPDVAPPARVEGAPPRYPEAARERGIEGAPIVEVWIGESGDVVDVAIVESAGALLDGALLEAVAGWRFTPATLGGVPVSVRMTIQHHFRR